MSLRIDRNSLCLIGIILLSLGAYGYLILRPQYLRVEKLNQELQQLQEGIAQTQDLLMEIQNVQKELEKANRYVEAWRAELPAPQELAPLFGQITQLAKQCGLTPTRFTPGNKVSYDRVLKIPLNMAYQGSFPQICDFLYHLESLPQIVWIEHLAIEKASQPTHQLQCELRIVIFTENPEG